MRLRDYQEEDVASIFAEWKEVKSTLYVAATGLGKTRVMTELAHRMLPKRTLFLCHRTELIAQARQAFLLRGMECEIEKAELQATTNLFSRTPVVLASVQTMLSGNDDWKRMNRFNPKDFGLLLYDESHHSVSPGNKRIVDYFTNGNSDLRVCGVTATPDRADEEALGQIFETVAGERDILWGRDNGWLVDVCQLFVPVAGLDFSDMRTTAGDLNGGDLAAVMEMESCVQGVVQPTVEHLFSLPQHSLNPIPVASWGEAVSAKGPQHRVIVFTVSVAQAEMLSNIFNRVVPGLSSWVCGKTREDDRLRILSDFKEGGATRILVNCGVTTEGYDNPAVDTIVMARPTKSRSLYAQCLDSSTEVLTNKGWLGIDSDWESCKAAAFCLDDSTIHWSIARFMERPLSGEKMYGIANPHLDICVTEGHRMVAAGRCGRAHTRQPWSFHEAGNFPNGVVVPVAGFQAAPGVSLSDAELTFIGLVLTDGNINKANGQITIYQSERYPEIILLIEDTLATCGFKFGKTLVTEPTNFGERSPLHRWTISRGLPRGRDKNLKGWNGIGKFIDKEIASSLEDMTREQLLVFIHALWAGDGVKKKTAKYRPGTWTICSGRKRFVERLQSLCVRRGLRCNVSAVSEKFWLVHISEDARWSVLTKTSDARPLWGVLPKESCERVWCVEVDSGAIVTRRNGKVAIVGNCIGRGTRPIPGLVDGCADGAERRAAISASSKPHVTVLDFVGNSGAHKLLCTANLLGGKVSDAAVDRAVKIAKERGQVKMSDVLGEAEEELRKEAEKRRLFEEARKNRLVAKSKYTTQQVNPFDVFALSPARERGWDSGKVLSEKQNALLLKQGIDGNSMSYPQAKAVLNEMFRRWNAKLATFKQCKLLQKHGYATKDLSMWDAGRLIDALAKNGWKRPQEVTA